VFESGLKLCRFHCVSPRILTDPDCDTNEIARSEILGNDWSCELKLRSDGVFAWPLEGPLILKLKSWTFPAVIWIKDWSGELFNSIGFGTDVRIDAGDAAKTPSMLEIDPLIRIDIKHIIVMRFLWM
jgi:hypothetical protein